MPAEGNFELVEVEVAEPGDGDVLVQNIYMSVDPYRRGRMRLDFPLGATRAGGGYCQVNFSKPIKTEKHLLNCSCIFPRRGRTQSEESVGIR